MSISGISIPTTVELSTVSLIFLMMLSTPPRAQWAQRARRRQIIPHRPDKTDKTIDDRDQKMQDDSGRCELMTQYVVFLRGVNVGGHNLVKTSDICRRLASRGFSNVKGYKQSGNIIF